MKQYQMILTVLVSLFVLAHSAQAAPQTAAPAKPANAVTPGKFEVEPPTLLCAGFEWNIQGDDNRNSSVEVTYRKKGTTSWKQALPLLRMNGEKIIHKVVGMDFTAPNRFAGSIFNLEPGGTYECRFVMKDPDGVKGQATQLVTVTTRPEPKAFEGGRVRHVYPPDYKGPKQEPSYVGVMDAYYGPGKSLWGTGGEFAARPGDIILVHAGLYKSDRKKYYEPLWMHFHGAYVLTKSGTPDKPIVIRGAGDGEAIFDADGVYRMFDVTYADYTFIENITIKNCDVAIMAGLRFAHGCQGLVVRNCRMENVGCGINAQYGGSKNFYIADNVILGKKISLPGWKETWAEQRLGAPLVSFIGIDINGQGHVVCHNYLAYFHDALDITEQGPPENEDWKVCSIDFYNNDFYMMSDDFVEADCAAHNIRVFKNRGFNAGTHAYSAQPIYGGPAYFIRNIAYHVPTGGAFKYNIYPVGILTFHNTLCSEWTTSSPFQNVTLRNNLFLGEDAPKRPILRVTTYTSSTTFDYDGYRPTKDVEVQFVWRSPGEGKTIDYELKNPLTGSFKTPEEFFKATGREEHGILVDYDIFRNVTKADFEKPNTIYDPKDFDFRLKPDAKAVDAGCILPNINDDFTGKAPDLGALEVGAPDEVYGPRTRNRP
ncbi:MAG: hypothetical protein Q8O92_04270 [Candidatus Latescibacter sp.]|nr:hypothetical protein [Candidatus Latescibacter sp.]